MAMLPLARNVVAGPAGDELDRAADGVLAVERALRAAQDFDPLDVEQVELVAADARQIDVVDIDADGRVERLQRVRLADAADEDVGRVGRAAALDDVEVGTAPCRPVVSVAWMRSSARSLNAETDDGTPGASLRCGGR